VSVIEVADVRRTYRSRSGMFRRRLIETHALQGISFEVECGELFGLLGPNGAGKTTTIKILTTLLLPNSGSVRVLGLDAVTQYTQLRRRIGYVFGGDKGLYDRISALDNLRFFADVYRVPLRAKQARIEELLEIVGLRGRERERVETYSRGMRQRLHIARGLLHDPEVLFLDEPTIGLDPVGARELRETVANLQRAGKTILLTTHYMLEADELCDRIAIITGGRIVADGTPVDLKRGIPERNVIEIEAFGVTEASVDRLRLIEGVEAVSVEEQDQAQLIVVSSRRGPELIAPLLGALGGANLGRVVAREPTLEDAYVRLVGGS
jgi:ABC-2 type transport system ATP-binding protein